MKKLYFVGAVLITIGFLSLWTFAHAGTVLFPIGGGTGTSSPSGILYGTNNNSPLQTVVPGANCTFSAGVFNCTATGGTGLATTTPVSSSNLLVYSASGAGAAYGVATSTLTAGTGLSGSFTQIGSGGTLSLDNSGNWAGTWQTFSPSHFQTAGTYLTALGNYSTTTGTAISLSTTTATVNGLTYGINIAPSTNGIFFTPTVTGTYSGQAGSVANAVTFNSSGGAAANTSFNGSSAVTVDYHTVGAQVAGSYESPLTFSAPLLRTSNTISWTGLATSTAISANQVLFGTSASGVSSVATTTIGTSGPFLTTANAGGLVGGSNLTITWTGLATTTSISANQVLFGTSANGVSSVGTTTETYSGPFSVTANAGGLVGGSNKTITWSGLATSTAISANQVLFGTSASGVSSVGTTTLSISGPFINTANVGGLVGGSNATFTFTGLATTSQPTAGQLLVSNGGAGVFGTATNTISGSGAISVTAGASVLASGAISVSCATCNTSNATVSSIATNNGLTGGTITTTGTIGLATIAANNVLANGSGATAIPTAIATSTFFGANYIINSAGLSGFGTSTPWGLFSLNPNNLGVGVPFFAIGSTSQTVFSIGQGGSISLTETKIATSTTQVIDWRASGPVVTVNIGLSAVTIQMINATTSFMNGSHKIINICNAHSGTAGALTWATGNNILWPAQTAPTQTTTADHCDIYSFIVTTATSTSVSPSYSLFGASTANF